MILTVDDVLQWLAKSNEKMQMNKEYLTELDQAIGDGDHGINMARGLGEIVDKTADQNYASAGDVFNDTAMTFISKVGGAAGPLYGTAFLRMSTAVQDGPLDSRLFSEGLQEAINGIKQRGKAEEGEKTLFDVWSRMAAFFHQAKEFRSAPIAEEARIAMEKTRDMVATKGRASYFGDRSIGHIDPGSASSYYIFEALAEVIGEKP